ncbi:MAG: DNA-processing protein DprA [Nitrospiraceae bacterium]|nr:DNA-processing protein DprA [Nitrospiraceae bacterium]
MPGSKAAPVCGKHLLALCSIREIGPLTIKRLFALFGSAQKVFEASEQELLDSGLTPKKAQCIARFSGWKKVERDLTYAHEHGIKLLVMESPEYPEALKSLPDPPRVLFAKGDIQPEDCFALAVVGSRMPTNYGLSQSENISGALAGMGFTIVSGLARGIDTAAHKAALGAGGRSIGVMGSGLDVPYPAENKKLMGDISRSGAVISEFCFGTLPNKENFPRRNRIISGLSLGVLVVEAAAGSGSLITAHCALDQNKEVFAIPGNISSGLSKGTNELIKKGAAMVMSAEDIVEELAPVLKGFLRKKPAETDSKKMTDLTEDEKKVIKHLGQEPRHIDDICREMGAGAAWLSTVLLGLELSGHVRQSAGKRFSIC